MYVLGAHAAMLRTVTNGALSTTGTPLFIQDEVASYTSRAAGEQLRIYYGDIAFATQSRNY